jgi:hypothetical protein
MSRDLCYVSVIVGVAAHCRGTCVMLVSLSE